MVETLLRFFFRHIYTPFIDVIMITPDVKMKKVTSVRELK